MILESEFDVWRGYIRAGMERLNKDCPQWREKISIEKLNMRNSSNCVLGQVYGDYSIGCNELNIQTSYSTRPAEILGFNAPEGDDWWNDCVTLTKLWQEMLAE